MKPLTKQWFVDASERVGLTFVEAAAGVIVLTPVLHFTVIPAALTAGTIAAAAAVKTLVSGLLNGTGSIVG